MIDTILAVCTCAAILLPIAALIFIGWYAKEDIKAEWRVATTLENVDKELDIEESFAETKNNR